MRLSTMGFLFHQTLGVDPKLWAEKNGWTFCRKKLWKPSTSNHLRSELMFFFRKLLPPTIFRPSIFSHVRFVHDAPVFSHHTVTGRHKKNPWFLAPFSRWCFRWNPSPEKGHEPCKRWIEFQGIFVCQNTMYFWIPGPRKPGFSWMAFWLNSQMAMEIASN